MGIFNRGVSGGRRVSSPRPVRTSGTSRAAKSRVSQPTQNTSYTRAPQTAQPTVQAPAKKGVERTVVQSNKAPETTQNAPRARAPQQEAAPTQESAAPASWQDKMSQGWNLLKEGAKGGLQEKFGSNPTPEERVAMEYVRDMLDPNKLGGEDRVFNYGDRQAIINSLMRDRAGLKQEVASQLRAEGKDWQVGTAMKAIDGKRGILPGIARRKINSEAPARMNQQLSQGLRDANIDPNTARQIDQHPRDVTFNEVREFERNAEILQDMQKRVAEKLGMDVTFPNGISQEAIDFTLQGKFGIPPGAVLTPRNK
ncbi:MAG: hypothetical protein EP343_29870 [Deltaproteobacteria bacterium]|nr:MAG: hypothetical protein EP343_29870 [Deltaproteobacteria bacterium]